MPDDVVEEYLRKHAGATRDDEPAFRSWYAQQVDETEVPGFRLDENPDAPEHHYDWRSAYRAGARPQKDEPSGLYHWPSEFKADDHPRRFLHVDAHGREDPSAPLVDTKTGNAAGPDPVDRYFEKHYGRLTPTPTDDRIAEEFTAQREKGYDRHDDFAVTQARARRAAGDQRGAEDYMRWARKVSELTIEQRRIREGIAHPDPADVARRNMEDLGPLSRAGLHILDTVYSAAEGVTGELIHKFSTDEQASALENLRGTLAEVDPTITRLTEAGGRMAGAALPIGGAAKLLGAGAKAAGLGAAAKYAATPLAVGGYSAATAPEGERLKAGLEGTAFAALAGGIGGPFNKWLERFPTLKRAEALRNLAAAGISMPTADAILHGIDGERALEQLAFGVALGGTAGRERTPERLAETRAAKAGAQAERTTRHSAEDLAIENEQLAGSVPEQGVTPSDQLRAASAQAEYVREAASRAGADAEAAAKREFREAAARRSDTHRFAEILVEKGVGSTPQGPRLTDAIRQRFPDRTPAEAADAVMDLYDRGKIDSDRAAKELGLQWGPGEKQGGRRKRQMYVPYEGKPPVETLTRQSFPWEQLVEPGIVTTDPAKARSSAAAAAAERAAQEFGDIPVAERGAPPPPPGKPIADELVPASEPAAEASPPAAPTDESGSVRPNTKERGAINPHAFSVAASDVRNAIVRETGSMIGRLRSYGKPATTRLAIHAERVINQTRDALGELSGPLANAMKAGGSSPLSKQGRALIELERPRPVGRAAADSPLMEMVEGRTKPTSPEETKAVESLRDLIEARGRLFEREGVKRYDSAAGGMTLFRVNGREIAPRIMAPAMLDVVSRGRGSPGWKPLIDAFAEVNPGVPRVEIEKHFLERHESVNNDGPDALVRQQQAEFKREWARVPAFAKVDGEWVPMFESRMYEYAKKLAERGAARVGFLREFGADQDRQGKILERLRTEVTDVVGKRKAGPDEVTMVMRTLHGLPAEGPLVDQSSRGARVGKAFHDGLSLIRSALLSASAPTNLSEPFGAMIDVAGNRGFAKAWWEVTKAYVARMKGKGSILDTLELQGSITRAVADLSFDPSAPVSSSLRAAREASGFVFMHRIVNEWQEKMAAVIGDQLAQRLRAGTPDVRDSYRLRTFGFSAGTRERLLSGQGTADEIADVARRSSGRMVGALLHPLEQSRFENRALAQATIPFQRYASTIWRQTGRQFEAFAGEMREAYRAGLDTKAGAVRAATATRQLVRFFTGKALQGAGSYFAIAYATGGTLGLKTAWNEAKDRPFSFALEGLAYTLLAGPAGAIARAATTDTSPAKMVLPIWAASELHDALAGDGAYKNKSFGTRMWQLTERVVPATRMVENGLVAVGLGSPEAKDIEVARRAYWRWRFDQKLRPEHVEDGDTPEQQQAFRTQMGEAYRVATSLDAAAVKRHVEAAMGIAGKDEKSAASSLRNRRLLTQSMVRDRLPDLKKRIGDEAYRKLELHDRLIDRLIRAIEHDGDYDQAIEKAKAEPRR